MEQTEIKELVGKTVTRIEKSINKIEFHCKNEKSIFANIPLVYVMHHIQDCTESVTVDDVCGDLDDLLDTPILKAEEITSRVNPENVDMDMEYQESFTWTFYHLATIKGYVTIRWYGESNGYYSENVDFCVRDYR